MIGRSRSRCCKRNLPASQNDSSRYPVEAKSRGSRSDDITISILPDMAAGIQLYLLDLNSFDQRADDLRAAAF